MALAAEPAVTGKLPGDSGGRGGELFGSQAQNHSKKRSPRSVLGSQAPGPTPQPGGPACGKEPLSRAQPFQALSFWQSGQERASSTGRPSGAANLSKPCLCPQIPRSLPAWLQGLPCSQMPLPSPLPA